MISTSILSSCMHEDAYPHNGGFHLMSFTVLENRASQTCNFIFAVGGYNK